MIDTQFGEGFAGDGANAAHLNTVLGAKGGPVETAWATALATPSAGHVPFVCVIEPGLAVQPFTLFVTKAAIVDDHHGTLVWGAAQAGVAGGVADAVAEGIIGDPTTLVLIAAVWVSPSAHDADAVYLNNRSATHTALANGALGRPVVADVLARRAEPWNPFYRSTT